MGIRFLNKNIGEPEATAVLSCLSNATISAGLPVGVYVNSSGVWRCENAVIGSQSNSWGITAEAATASGQAINVVIGGQATLKGENGTVGQLITDITAAGSAVTAAVASATSVLGLGVQTGSFTVILY